MSTQVTLTLPDELYEYARRWATITQRDLAETLTDALPRNCKRGQNPCSSSFLP